LWFQWIFGFLVRCSRGENSINGTYTR
jgi:hypothetical protein